MIRRLRTLLIAWGVVALVPLLARAETVILRNDTMVPVIVQGTCIVKGQVIRSRPVQIQPGDTGNIVLPGNKIITVHAAGPPLLKINTSTIPAGKEDLYLSIQVDTPTKAKLEPYTPAPPK